MVFVPGVAACYKSSAIIYAQFIFSGFPFNQFTLPATGPLLLKPKNKKETSLYRLCLHNGPLISIV